MKPDLFCNKYLILILSFFSHAVINIGGEVSPSFLFILGTTLWWFDWKRIKRDSSLYRIVRLILILIVIQCLWAFFYSFTDAVTQLKGVMISVSGLFMFLFYYIAASRKQAIIKWYELGTFLASFIFSNMIALRDAEFVENYYLWKFQVYPRIVVGVACVYIFLNRNLFIQRYAALAFIGVGFLGVATGSRSAGLVPLISGAIVLVIKRTKHINFRKIGGRIMCSIVALYAAYAFIYVPGVLSGSITGGNTEQLRKADNPYNPLYLLMIGRSDSVVPFLAFFDSPLLGWGYNTKDPNYKYHEINADLQKEEFRLDHVLQDKIPGHSVLGTYACSYGIIAFILLIKIVMIVIKRYMNSLRHPNRLILYLTYLMIGGIWTLLFNPMPSFKLTWTITLAFILVLSNNQKKRYITNK